MSRQLRQLSWLTIERDNHLRRHFIAVSRLALLALMLSFSVFARAAEAPGELTFIVKNQNTGRPLANVLVTITKRESDATQAVETDSEGRIVGGGADPLLGLDGLPGLASSSEFAS